MTETCVCGDAIRTVRVGRHSVYGHVEAKYRAPHYAHPVKASGSTPLGSARSEVRDSAFPVRAPGPRRRASRRTPQGRAVSPA